MAASTEASNHNVFILGAGFSREAGAPLIHDFLDMSRELFDDPDSDLDKEERSQFREVFEFKNRVSQAREKFRIDLDNIEQLFGLVEMSHRLGSGSAETRDASADFHLPFLRCEAEDSDSSTSITWEAVSRFIESEWSKGIDGIRLTG